MGWRGAGGNGAASVSVGPETGHGFFLDEAILLMAAGLQRLLHLHGRSPPAPRRFP